MDVQLQIENEMDELYKKNYTLVIMSHVASYQDKVIGPLTWEATLNVKVDALARENSFREVPDNVDYPKSRLQLYDGIVRISRSI